VIEIELPLSGTTALSLRAGDEVEFTGEVLTARDQACARLYALIQERRPLPVELAGTTLYFVGPTPAPHDRPIGSAGPTTSGRMNPFLPTLLGHGLRGFIGKGHVSQAVHQALEANHAVYFGAIGGTGALLATSIRAASLVAFPDLLSEAIFRLTLVRFPAIVLHDARGGDLYRSVRVAPPHSPPQSESAL
jgi:fumarate hydratase subunit beta